LHQIANSSPGRDMIFQKFGQGVSNLSTVAELRTFDGTSLKCKMKAGYDMNNDSHFLPWLNPVV
jgi:hypothetical protein